ncbi:hypothetical protein R3P38DRAFT_2502027 [Favolaschia claudopus]|uniref:Uncharacterized protein n=1 Tax=Favolaschia claudopus TaxID=2862362 RepID=A0AAW0DP48_9AGAR
MLLFFLLPLPALLQVVDALRNVTVDDVGSPLISYQGKWEPSSTHPSGSDWGGSHSLSSDSQASATFIFTGVAVYHLSPRWPYDVHMRLTLDGGQSVLVNLTDPSVLPQPPGGGESAPSSVAWSATGLENKSHTLVATYGNFIIVDAFIYTIDDDPSSSSSVSHSSTSTSSSSATLAASSADASSIPSNRNALTVGLATALGLSVFVAAILLAFGVWQRRRFKRARSARPTTTTISDWGSYLRGTRGAYAAVSTAGPGHGLEMSDASSSRLLYSEPTDPWAPKDAVDYSSHPSASSNATASSVGRTPSTMGRSVARSQPSSSTSGALPVGAMPPVVPGPYVDRVPPELKDDDEEDDDDPGEGAPLSRAPSSGILFVVRPVNDPVTSPGGQSEFRISSPAPPYSER